MAALRVARREEAPNPQGGPDITSVLLVPVLRGSEIQGQVIIGFLNPEDAKELIVDKIIELSIT